MKREGRPPKAIKQEKNIGFFVTWNQYFIIKQKADAAGVNMSDYMRQAAVYAQVKSRWRVGDQELVRELEYCQIKEEGFFNEDWFNQNEVLECELKGY